MSDNRTEAWTPESRKALIARREWDDRRNALAAASELISRLDWQLSEALDALDGRSSPGAQCIRRYLDGLERLLADLAVIADALTDDLDAMEPVGGASWR